MPVQQVLVEAGIDKTPHHEWHVGQGLVLQQLPLKAVVVKLNPSDYSCAQGSRNLVVTQEVSVQAKFTGKVVLVGGGNKSQGACMFARFLFVILESSRDDAFPLGSTCYTLCAAIALRIRDCVRLRPPRCLGPQQGGIQRRRHPATSHWLRPTLNLLEIRSSSVSLRYKHTELLLSTLISSAPPPLCRPTLRRPALCLAPPRPN